MLLTFLGKYKVGSAISTYVLIFLTALIFISCKTTSTDSGNNIGKNDLAEKEGWYDRDTYYSYGEAKVDESAKVKKETLEDACRRRSIFNARNKIIPAFMNSPKAKPSYEIKQKMADLLKYIENSDLLEFKFNPAKNSCRVLIRVFSKDLRGMVEDIQ